MREARGIEQSHNPNYLKAKSSKQQQQQNHDKTNVDDIPIQELTLDVPIQITCKLLGFIYRLNISNEISFDFSHKTF